MALKNLEEHLPLLGHQACVEFLTCSGLFAHAHKELWGRHTIYMQAFQDLQAHQESQDL